MVSGPFPRPRCVQVSSLQSREHLYCSLAGQTCSTLVVHNCTMLRSDTPLSVAVHRPISGSVSCRLPRAPQNFQALEASRSTGNRTLLSAASCGQKSAQVYICSSLTCCIWPSLLYSIVYLGVALGVAWSHPRRFALAWGQYFHCNWNHYLVVMGIHCLVVMCGTEHAAYML